jgi:hypothetical protein
MFRAKEKEKKKVQAWIVKVTRAFSHTFDLIGMNLGSVTSGVGRWQSEKDITSAPRSHFVHTKPGVSVVAFPLVGPLDLILFLSLVKSSLCVWMALLGKKLSRYSLDSPIKAGS